MLCALCDLCVQRDSFTSSLASHAIESRLVRAETGRKTRCFLGAERTVSWFRGFVVFVVLVMSVAVTVAQRPGVGDVAVSASVDRTAMFVGDRATYTIELTCKRGVEILPDDLSGDKLKLEGLELAGSDNSRQSGRDGATTYQFRYVVTTYRVDAPRLAIGPVTVRYATTRPGQRLEEAAPAGEAQGPPASSALSRALPG